MAEKKLGPWEPEALFVRALSLIISVVVASINNFLKFFIRTFSKYEMSHTFTEYTLSVAFKMFIATFLNSAVIPIIIFRDPATWFTDFGFVNNIMIYALSLAIVKPCVDIVNPPHIVKRFLRWFETKKGIRSKMNQKQANLLFENPLLDMADRYSHSMLLFFFTCTFSALTPLVVPISLVGMIM